MNSESSTYTHKNNQLEPSPGIYPLIISLDVTAAEQQTAGKML